MTDQQGPARVVPETNNPNDFPGAGTTFWVCVFDQHIFPFDSAIDEEVGEGEHAANVACDAINNSLRPLIEKAARAEEIQKENEEQARLLSMSAERETALLDKVRRLENMLGQYLDGPDAPRITDWAMSSPRKPANVAFTAGPERQIAYWIEWAQEQVKRK